MCGIVGLLAPSGGGSHEALLNTVTRMSDTIVHRGPDDSGAWADAASGIAMGSRRLAILDLSPEGHQPMRCACGRYVVAFNGEIYNFGDLRRELEALGRRFRGHSDTEVLIEGVCAWGLVPTVERCVGMFAFAVWDTREQVLHLVRDRLGKKPLYYGWMDGVFLFGSELRTLRAHPGFRGEIDRGALGLFLRLSQVPAPYSIYRGVHKLPPGTVLSLASPSPGDLPDPAPYWSLPDVVRRGLAGPFAGSPQDAVDQLDALLRDAVRLRMIADVPLGAFLSGGIDSSLLVALMQAQSTQPVRTFTIGFMEDAFNEAGHARRVAEHLGTDHTELTLTPREVLGTIPRLPVIYDEPFADASQLPTFLVSELTRRHVTVSLSGDGGDELFGGYVSYRHTLDLWRKIGWLPPAARRAVAGLLTLVPVGARGKRLVRHLRQGPLESVYSGLMTHWPDWDRVVVPGAPDLPTVLTDPGRWITADPLDRMMALDMAMYLPDDILVKVDRAGMAASLETRAPLLDHRVVEFAWRIPHHMKLRGGEGKWLLRRLLDRYVPRDLVERPKKGFSVPVGAWLAGPLRPWAEELLGESRLKRDGFLDPQRVRGRWNEFLAGREDRKTELWIILMFQAWLDTYHRR